MENLKKGQWKFFSLLLCFSCFIDEDSFLYLILLMDSRIRQSVTIFNLLLVIMHRYKP